MTYTIQVDRLYYLNILAPIAAMLEWKEDEDEWGMDMELETSISCLLSELVAGKLRFDRTQDHPEKWRLIAHLSAELSKKITESMEGMPSP